MPRLQCARIVATIRVNCYSSRDPRQAQRARILEAGIYGTRTYGRLLSVNDLFGPAMEFIGQCGALASRTPEARQPVRQASFSPARARAETTASLTNHDVPRITASGEINFRGRFQNTARRGKSAC